MERSSENQGELSLIEMIENFNKPDGKRTTESSSSASIAIALNEEMNRRQVFFSFFFFINYHYFLINTFSNCYPNTGV